MRHTMMAAALAAALLCPGCQSSGSVDWGTVKRIVQTACGVAGAVLPDSSGGERTFTPEPEVEDSEP